MSQISDLHKKLEIVQQNTNEMIEELKVLLKDTIDLPESDWDFHDNPNGFILYEQESELAIFVTEIVGAHERNEKIDEDYMDKYGWTV